MREIQYCMMPQERLRARDGLVSLLSYVEFMEQRSYVLLRPILLSEPDKVKRKPAN